MTRKFFISVILIITFGLVHVVFKNNGQEPLFYEAFYFLVLMLIGAYGIINHVRERLFSRSREEEDST